ncbi:MAG TPA: LytTR family DNA-binding domain-containing protein [Burkholderiaceae bacterium]|jgi:two-component system response regulator AlgR
MTSTVLKVLIVDDEPLARLRLRGLLEACADPRVEVLAEAGSASQAETALRDHADCDLVLLDIQMPGPDGLQLARALRERAAGPAVVFVTAHAEHALQAFELDAFDYLTKPVRRERLQAALARAVQRLGERAAARQEPSPALDEEDGQFIVVSDRGRMSRVPLTEVLYLKAELKYLTLRTATQSLVLDGALSDFEQRLGEKFLRVHRNALVAKSAVRELQRHAPLSEAAALDADAGEGIDGWAVRIAKVDEWLAVSRRQVAVVREALGAQD